MLLYACSDLLWASKIKSTAESLGLPCRPARNGEMLSARLAESPVKAMLIDLTSEHAWTLLDSLRGPKAIEGGSRVTVLCFGPHVEADAFRRASEMGAIVLTRGGLAANLPRVLTALASGEAVTSSMAE